ncbi:MAG TPA: hypothetical protein VLB05_12195, partial [Dongiaceae bacterium]|nr:hypothetical protein [Dongiaceae bacterium]
MKISRPQPAAIRRRTLLRGAAALGAAAFALGALPRLALSETAQAAQLTDTDKADIARVEEYLNGITTMK